MQSEDTFEEILSEYEQWYTSDMDRTLELQNLATGLTRRISQQRARDVLEQTPEKFKNTRRNRIEAAIKNAEKKLKNANSSERRDFEDQCLRLESLVQWEDGEIAARKAVQDGLKEIAKDPVVKASHGYLFLLRIISVGLVFRKSLEDVLYPIERNSARRKNSKAAKIKAEKEQKKPNPRCDYVKEHWDAWIAKPDLYDTLTFFYQEMRDGIERDLKLKPPTDKTMKTWSAKWPRHPRAHKLIE